MSARKAPRPASGDAWGIVSPYGDVWTYDHYPTADVAWASLKEFWSKTPRGTDLSEFRVVPVLVTVEVAPQALCETDQSSRDGRKQALKARAAQPNTILKAPK